MPTNPSIKQETLNNPIQRGNPLNDPKYINQQGYNTYDLNNGQMLTPRFAEVTPSTVFETVPGDRHFLYGKGDTFLNQIDARMCSDVNAYHDYFFVPMRCVFPVNYEKMIPNPVKGDDLPWKALPQIPLLRLLNYMFTNSVTVVDDSTSGSATVGDYLFQFIWDPADESQLTHNRLLLNNLLYVAFALSRGQLLDYLGYSLDRLTELYEHQANYGKYINTFQKHIDDFFDIISQQIEADHDVPTVFGIDASDPTLAPNHVIFFDSDISRSDIKVKYGYGSTSEDWTLSSWRAALYDCFEKGLLIDLRYFDGSGTEYDIWSTSTRYQEVLKPIFEALLEDLRQILWRVELTNVDEEEPFSVDFVNPSRIVAYQMSVAEYMSNDTIDNIYTAELWMQNMRALMFPSDSSLSREPTFDYNGVDTEYDLFTTGAFEYSFFDGAPRFMNRILPFLSNLLFLRRSLRYGDYFATGRPNLLAVGQLGIPVTTQAGVTQVNPIDVTKNLVLQRFLNAVNWIGSKFVNYMTSIFGVKPSNTGVHPVFIAHRKVSLARDTVTNTASEQGKQTTNLIGSTDEQAFDVFIDDLGIIIGVVTFDALPVYPSGIDRNWSNSDRYSIFNPMLQNVGDQDIKLYELTGVVDDPRSEDPFAYGVRYGQYKWGITRAHGAFVNSLPGYCMLYPWHALSDDPGAYDLKINPDFIRDKPFYFDQFFVSRTGVSPATYYHFIQPVFNLHNAARKMQYQPPVL